MIKDDVYLTHFYAMIYHYYWLSCITCLWNAIKFTVLIIVDVYLSFEKQLHLLMYLNIMEYADTQCSQIHIPRDELSKIILIILDF